MTDFFQIKPYDANDINIDSDTSSDMTDFSQKVNNSQIRKLQNKLLKT